MMVRPYESGSIGLASVITQAITGVGKVTLDYMDAFCATERCKEAKRQRETDLQIAKLGFETAKVQAEGLASGAELAKRTQTIAAVVGIGVLGLGAWWLAGRNQ